MRFVIVENGVVSQVVEAPDQKIAKLIAGKNTAVQSDTANIGDSYSKGVFTARGANDPLPSIEPIVEMEMRRRIHDAYVDEAHMKSAHAYLSQLSAELQLGTISEEEKEELKLLVAAGRWEDAMVKTRDKIVAKGDAMLIHEAGAWPSPPDGLLELAKKC